MPDDVTGGAQERLGADGLRALIDRVHDAFVVHRDEIDELNVFPVPDGDTGTNLVLTLRTMCEETADADDAELPQALAKGALMGARGNSGVIFSQVVRGLTDAFSEHGGLDVAAIVDALSRARDHAYDAVADPVEGTMLTVISRAADVAAAVRDEVDGLPSLLTRVVEEVHEAVERTTEQLDALRDAGVVDAGARGFEVFLETWRRLVAGEGPDVASQPAPIVRRSGRTAEREAGSSRFRFEVQYLLEAPEEAAQPLRERLTQLGDSVVVVAAGGHLNVHVHTNDIGPAIEAGVAHGTPSRIDVTEFARQVTPATESEGGDDVEEPEVGVVTVLPGGRLIEVAEEHGATVIEGRAGALPSVADLLSAAGSTRGRRVVILPGHPNVVPAAHQAAEVSSLEGGRDIEVVDAAASPPAVLAALSVGEGPEAMAEAAAACRSGEIVAAVRDAETPIGEVRAGQLLVVARGDVVAVADDPVEAVVSLVRAIGARDAELITVVVGADVGEDERVRVIDAIDDEVGSVEFDVIEGGQRPARYLIGVE